LLSFHDRVSPFHGDFVRNRIIKRGGFRPRFGRICEDTDVVELHLLNEIIQLRARMVDESTRHFNVAWAIHCAENCLVGMLNRHVEIWQQLFVLRHHVDHP
jgi:hypothetical protein